MCFMKQLIGHVTSDIGVEKWLLTLSVTTWRFKKLRVDFSLQLKVWARYLCFFSLCKSHAKHICIFACIFLFVCVRGTKPSRKLNLLFTVCQRANV